MKARNTNFNNFLMKKSVEIERQCWASTFRRECLEVSGKPTSIPQQKLGEKERRFGKYLRL